MAANVLNSPQAVEMSVVVVRAFVRMRHMVSAHKELTGILSELERKIGTHDEQIELIFDSKAHDAAGAEQTQDRISGEGTSSAVRKNKNGHFDVSRILETSKCRYG
jgi:hypothetical protein